MKAVFTGADLAVDTIFLVDLWRQFLYIAVYFIAVSFAAD
jgi:hypothetical protein